MRSSLPSPDVGVRVRLEQSERYPRWVLWTALAGMFATTFPITILTVSLGDIARDFDSSETTLAWVISAPMLAAAMATPVLGKLGDLYGHRRIFLTGFVVATVVAAATALAWNAGSLIALRTVAQTIGAATQPTSMALIMTVFAPADRVKAMGWWSLVAAGSPAVGLVVGGPLVDAFGWRLVFVVQAALAVVPVAAAALVLRETARRDRVQFDVGGAATLTLGVGAAMFALNQGAEWGWLSPIVVVTALGAPVLIAAFVAVERRVLAPLVPLEFFRRRNFTAPVVSSFFSGSAYFGGFILAPLLLRFVFGYSISTTSLVMLVRPLAFSGASPVGGQFGTRFGERTAAVTGTAVLAGAMVFLAVGAGAESIGLVVVGLVGQGLGNGLSRPSLTASVGNSVGEGDFGIAAATMRMAWQVGSAVGITVLTVLYGGMNEPEAFFRAYLVGAVLGTIGMVAATGVRSAER